MTIDPLLGPAFPEHGWIPAPRYLMRRARIRALARGMPPGRLLEVGPGAAVLLAEFSARGFRCEALEASGPARAMASRFAAELSQDIGVHATPPEDPRAWAGRFDALFAFDVLEHIEDDAAALAQWHDWLRPGGQLLLSVPARMALWTAGDAWAGHFRRYERDALRALVARAGFRIDAFECYGFPLTNLTEKASARAYARTMVAAGDGDREASNLRSGIDRRPVLRLYPVMRSWPGRLALRAAMGVQALFLSRDWGSGYLLRATRT